MKKIVYFAALLAAIAFASCQKQEDLQNTPDEPVVEQHEAAIDAPDFYATIEGQGTKAGFTKEGSVYRHYWELGDVIYVIRKGVENGYPCKYSCTDANTGRFSFVSEATELTRISGTPDKNYAAAGQFIDFDLGTENFKFGFNGGTDIAAADKNGAYGYSNNMVAASVDNNLTFKNTHGWLKLSLTGTQKVASIDVTGGVATAGDYYVTYNGSSVPNADTSEMEDGWRRLSIAAPYAELNTTTATDFYIAFTPLTFNGIRVTVNFADGTSQVLEKAGTSITIDRNAVTPMGEKYVSVPISNLSSAGTANCYIVNDAAKTYRFKADVKGNSNESVGTPVRADVLWTSLMTNAATPSKNSVLENVRFFDGYIYFNTKETYIKGNTVIAIYDASDNILWSWHIWSPGVSNMATSETTVEGSMRIMTNNLGAVDSDPGLYYQWGRKDPFVRQGYNLGSGENITTYPVNALHPRNNTYLENHGIGAPDTFTYKFATWAETVDPEEWSETEKTIYDPCPNGWRVMRHSSVDNAIPGSGNYIESITTELENRGWGFTHGIAHMGCLIAYNELSTQYFKIEPTFCAGFWTSKTKYSLQKDENGKALILQARYGFGVGQYIRCERE